MHKTGRLAHALLLGTALAAGTFSGGSALAQSGTSGPQPTFGDWSGVGIMQIPTARFMPDGQFSIGGAYNTPYTRLNASLQALPWLELGMSYTLIDAQDLRPRSPAGTTLYRDRQLDLRIRLWDEGPVRPAVAVGLRDFLGTDLFGSEYVVASKRIYDFDITAGIGWGMLAGDSSIRNPITAIFPGAEQRTRSTRNWGMLGDHFFQGRNIAFFGGIEYQTPIDGLKLQLEYDPIDHTNPPTVRYIGRQQIRPSDPASPINVGLTYSPWPMVQMGLSLQQGNTLMYRLRLTGNLNAQSPVPAADPPPAPIRPRPPALSGIAALPSDSGHDLAPGPMGAPQFAIVHEPDDLRQARLGQLIAETSPDSGAAPAEMLENLEPVRAAARDQGLEVTDIRLRDDQAEITVEERQPGAQARGVPAVARAAARQLRADRRQVVIRTVSGGQEIGWQSYNLAMLRTALGGAQPLPAVLAPPAPIEPGDPSPPRYALTADGTLQPIGAGPIGGDGAAASSSAATIPSAVRRQIAQAIFDDLESEGFEGYALSLEGNRATLYSSPGRYRETPRAAGRIARHAANHLPANIEDIRIVLRSNDLDVVEISMLRRSLESAATDHGSAEELWRTVDFSSAPDGIPAGAVIREDVYPHYDWSIAPNLRQIIGGGNEPYLYQIDALLSGRVTVLPGLSLSGALSYPLIGNITSSSGTASTSSLPPVRSNFHRYQSTGTLTINRLHADYITNLAPDIYARASAGILESMYAGVSGEVLYRPVGEDWALGAELNWVRQRDFEQFFGLHDYSVATGHVSAYYQLPFYGLTGAVHAGRYLAGDHGVTLELTRRFDSGMEIGAYATFTNVSAADFGEGSFDKGVRITLPFDFFTARSTRSAFRTTIQPIAGDGGARLSLANRLYGLTQDASYRDFRRDWHSILR